MNSSAETIRAAYDRWKKADEEWKRQTADVLRLCGNDMILQVAWIIGGYKHMRAISLKLREFAYHSQHS